MGITQLMRDGRMKDSLSSDGSRIYFTHIHTALLSQGSVAGGETSASLKELRAFGGRWGNWATIAPDSSPLFVRDINTHEIYALDVRLP